MIDIATVLYITAVTLGLIGLDSLVSADTARTSVTVHPQAQSAGYHPSAASQYFDFEIRRIFDSQSVIQPPRVRIQNNQSLVSVLAHSAGVSGLQAAVQDTIGLDPITINLVVHAPPTQSAPAPIQIYGRSSGAEVFDIKQTAEPDDVRGSLRRAAMAAALAIDPYYARLDQFRALREDSARIVSRIAADKRISFPEAAKLHQEDDRKRLGDMGREIRHEAESLPPYDRHRLGSIFNLVGVIAFAAGDLAGAERAFRESVSWNSRLATPRLNLATVLLVQRKAAEVPAILEQARVAIDRGAGHGAARPLLRQVLSVASAMAAAENGRADAAVKGWRDFCSSGGHLRLVSLHELPEWSPGQKVAACAQRLEAAGSAAERDDSRFGDADDIAAELLLFSPANMLAKAN